MMLLKREGVFSGKSDKRYSEPIPLDITKMQSDGKWQASIDSDTCHSLLRFIAWHILIQPSLSHKSGDFSNYETAVKYYE